MLDRRPMADSSGMLLRRRRTCGRSRFDDFSTDAGFARAPEPMAEPMRRHRPTPPSRETRPVRLRRVGHLVHAASRARCVRRADVVPRGRRRRPHSDPAPRRPIQHPHGDAWTTRFYRCHECLPHRRRASPDAYPRRLSQKVRL